MKLVLYILAIALTTGCSMNIPTKDAFLNPGWKQNQNWVVVINIPNFSAESKLDMESEPPKTFQEYEINYTVVKDLNNSEHYEIRADSDLWKEKNGFYRLHFRINHTLESIVWIPTESSQSIHEAQNNDGPYVDYFMKLPFITDFPMFSKTNEPVSFESNGRFGTQYIEQKGDEYIVHFQCKEPELKILMKWRSGSPWWYYYERKEVHLPDLDNPQKPNEETILSGSLKQF